MRLLRRIKQILFSSRTIEKLKATYTLGYRLKKTLKNKPRIGIAVLIWERAEYLEPCLDSLFKTELYDYDVTFLLNDDGSNDPKVRELIEKKRDSKYKIIRNYTPKGHGSWGAAFNKAIKKLLEIDKFDIIGTCDSDVLFNPEWLRVSVETFIWVKQNHKDHKLIKFSVFNSSDFEFHNVLGSYNSPFGKYTVRERMGDVTNMFFTEDLLKVGFYAEDKDDETLKTEFFKKHQLRYFSTETSYAEHIGQVSLLNQWRPTPVLNAVHAMKPVDDTRWNDLVRSFRVNEDTYYLEYDRKYDKFVFNANLINQRGLSIIIKNFLFRIYRRLLKKEAVSEYHRNQNWWKENLESLEKQLNVETMKGVHQYQVSNLSLDIVITAIERDLSILEHSLGSIKENLKHPINKIKVVAPDNQAIKDFCNKNQCEFVNERDILPFSPKDIDYFIEGWDRSGWLYQQLLKLSGDKVSDQDYYMVFDADTLLIRPHSFERNGKVVFDLSDEYHTPYYKAYEKLTGLYPKLPFSFVAHHMLIDQKILKEFKSHIERKHGKSWIEAIIESTDKNEISGFSEFESYGNYFFEVAKDRMIFEYWYNLSMGRRELVNVKRIAKENCGRYNTLSFQYYKN